MDFSGYEDLLVLPTEFDKALMGVVFWHGNEVALYDSDIIIEVLMEQNSWTYEEAVEYYDFNIACAYMENSPAFAKIFK